MLQKQPCPLGVPRPRDSSPTFSFKGLHHGAMEGLWAGSQDMPGTEGPSIFWKWMDLGQSSVGLWPPASALR